MKKLLESLNIGGFKYVHKGRLVCSMLIGYAHGIEGWQGMTPKDLYNATRQ